MPLPDVDLQSCNQFLIEQIAHSPGSSGLLLVKARTERDELRNFFEHPQIKGFKPYHVYGAKRPTFLLTPEGFVPPWTWEVAQEREWLIMLHIVRDSALADEANQRYIRENCQRYPRAKLVLAHAGRAFHGSNTVCAVSRLRDLDNLFFDTSAVCEASPLAAIIREFGPRRLLWGSDFPVSEQRGRAVTLGTGFAWLAPSQETLCGEQVLVGIEGLRALFEAADQIGLSEDDLADIFWRNAERLLSPSLATKDENEARYRQAKKIVPGGTQLVAKRPEMFAPNQWPAYFREARGCEVVDLNGRRYWDVSRHGIGACLLGYRDPDVTRAVQRQLTLGSFSTLNSPEEVTLAELLCSLHPWAEQVRLGRTGGEMMAVAVRIARATTDRSKVAVCGYHGWHDWYLAANLGENDALRGHLLPGLEPRGVPRELRGTTLPFNMNDRSALLEIINEHGEDLAAIVMEPCRRPAICPRGLSQYWSNSHL
jgi:glutamate-1-semialdehyde 2,1-aminomutase